MKTFLAMCVVLCAASVAAMAQGVCSTQTIKGSYAVTCDGYLTPGPGAPLAPAKALGVVRISADGVATGDGTISVGGNTMRHEVKSQSMVVNADCTGAVTYAQWLDGNPGPAINIWFVTLNSGKQIAGQAVDKGSIFACRLERM